MFDFNSLPISGGVIIAGVLWAGASVFALGPMVTDRALIRDNWLATCEADLKADIQSWRGPEPPEMPKLNCEATFGTIYGDQGRAFCDQYGNFDIPIPGLDVIRDQERRARETEARRNNRAASQAGSRCACAVSTYQAEHRLPLALYAGSGRLITPSQVKSRDAELTRALASPACAMKAEG